MALFPNHVDILNGHRERIWTITSIPNGNIASGSEDGTIKIWSNGICKTTLTGHFLAVFSLTVLENGVLVSASKDGSIRFWYNEIECYSPINEKASILAVKSLPNQHLASGSHLYINIYKFQDNSFQHVKTLEGHRNSVYCLTHKGTHLFSGSKDSTISMWSLIDYQNEGTFVGHTNTVCDILAHKDNIISSSLDSTIRIWNIHTRVCEKVLMNHNACIHALSHPSKRWFLSSGRDSQIICWDIETFLPIIISADHNCIVDVLLSSDNGNLYGGTVDGRILNWNYLSSIRTIDMAYKYLDSINKHLLVDVIIMFDNVNKFW